jgi:excisionase family DNA binding protein
MADASAPDYVLSLAEVAERLGWKTPKTVERMILRGELGCVTYGRRKFVRPDQLQAWIDAHTEDAPGLPVPGRPNRRAVG